MSTTLADPVPLAPVQRATAPRPELYVKTADGQFVPLGDPPTAVVTVRMTRRLHEQLRSVSRDSRISMNRLCLLAITGKIDQLRGEAAEGGTEGEPQMEHGSNTDGSAGTEANTGSSSLAEAG